MVWQYHLESPTKALLSYFFSLKYYYTELIKQAQIKLSIYSRLYTSPKTQIVWHLFLSITCFISLQLKNLVFKIGYPEEIKNDT
ncbi:MAG: hypothetical protein O7D30_01415, partial [Rickettsia endosymbiont of Ixodes persulcatus]|nr:hypothetical protein [Rickettsia endosymbiont of Ixodes persulcatus]